jgi:hypothetical protein
MLRASTIAKVVHGARGSVLDSVVSRGPLYWFQKLFDTHLPDWRQEPFSQRYAVGISTSDIWVAHVEAKRW